MSITYKGRSVQVTPKYIDKSLEQLLEGESWLGMRQRTQPARLAMEKENKQVELELKALLEQTPSEEEDSDWGWSGQ